MPSLAHYMAQYDHVHESDWSKFLHGRGIPLILAGIILRILMKSVWGAAFFPRGGFLLFVDHPIERNHPALFLGPICLLVGLIWVAKEAWLFLTGTHRRPASDATPQGDVTK